MKAFFRNIPLLVVTALSTASLVGPAAAQDEHAHHMHGGAPEMDADGKRDPGKMDHSLTPEQLADLREKIALYRALTDREAELNMAMMGPNYEWYVSDASVKGDVGVLVLAHGVGDNSDRLFHDSLKPMASARPTAISFGMAMMMSSHIQSSVDDLAAAGAKTIVLVPTATTRYNSLTRQWEYVFGMRDDSSYLDVPRVNTDANVIMTSHFEDHPLMTEILLDYAREKSTNPANETVIIVGHGPEDIEDNILDLELQQAHADRLKAEGGFADVKIINLQDDAYPPIRAANVKKLRRWVSSAERSGNTVIVVVATAASFGVQQKIIEDLRGLNYIFADKGFAEHPNYQLWIAVAVDERLMAEAQ
jgi:sirohydrochlorin cobaltochelatase